MTYLSSYSWVSNLPTFGKEWMVWRKYCEEKNTVWSPAERRLFGSFWHFILGKFYFDPYQLLVAHTNPFRYSFNENSKFMIKYSQFM